MIRILALDTGTHCGWASWSPRTQQQTSGVQVFELGRGESPGMRFLRFRKWLTEMVRLVSPNVIAYERSAHFKGVPAAEVCHGFQTVMLELAAQHEIDTAPVQNSSLKKYMTGKGNASKEEMVEAAIKRWRLDETPTHDQADALAVLAWAIEETRAGGRKIIIRTRR